MTRKSYLLNLRIPSCIDAPYQHVKPDAVRKLPAGVLKQVLTRLQLPAEKKGAP